MDWSTSKVHATHCADVNAPDSTRHMLRVRAINAASTPAVKPVRTARLCLSPSRLNDQTAHKTDERMDAAAEQHITRAQAKSNNNNVRGRGHALAPRTTMTSAKDDDE
jgi:hypothetical protein